MASSSKNPNERTPLMIGLLGAILALAAWFLYTSPARGELASSRKALDTAETVTAEVQAKVTNFTSGSDELDQALDRIRAAEALLPVFDANGLQPAQQLRLSVPPALKAGLEAAGLRDVAIGDFSVFSAEDIPPSIVAATIRVQFIGTSRQLRLAVEQISKERFPLTVRSDQLAFDPQAVASTPGCAYLGVSVDSCTAHAAELVVWYSTTPILQLQADGTQAPAGTSPTTAPASSAPSTQP
jgi:hypothetical protein